MHHVTYLEIRFLRNLSFNCENIIHFRIKTVSRKVPFGLIHNPSCFYIQPLKQDFSPVTIKFLTWFDSKSYWMFVWNSLSSVNFSFLATKNSIISFNDIIKYNQTYFCNRKWSCPWYLIYLPGYPIYCCILKITFSKNTVFSEWIYL